MFNFFFINFQNNRKLGLYFCLESYYLVANKHDEVDFFIFSHFIINNLVKHSQKASYS